MSYARELVDPNGTLPHVEFVVDQTACNGGYGRIRDIINISYQGAHIGGCVLVTQASPYQPGMHFECINLNDSYDRTVKGRGLSSYIVAIELAHLKGLPFESQPNSTQSAQAKYVWEILRDTGVAVELEPFAPSIFEDKFEGKYIVPVIGGC